MSENSPAVTLRDVHLDDKYADTTKPALVSGPQALVRLLIAQRRRDVAAGLDTAGFISGYRGSPLGYVDQAMWEAASWLKQHHVVFQPGVNEDLAATAVWGTQQLAVMKDATVDGVFALWYGKGPGVDRSGDVLKHGNYSGTHPHGGVLVLMGDDHPGKSSTIAHQSEQAVAAHQMPVLYPAGVAEVVRFGLLGWAMSRYSGCWVGYKTVNESIEQTATVAPEEDFAIATPDQGELPPEGIHYRGQFAPARDEIIHKRWRLPLALRFARANGIDRAEFGTPQLRLGIVTAGKSYGDVMQALRYLGIERERATALGLDVYKVGMIWPLEPQGLREFAAGCEELLFVEEKAAFMEPQAAALFYNDAQRPRITGKRDEDGAEQLASDVQLQPLQLAQLIAQRLRRVGRLDAQAQQQLAIAQSLQRALLPLVDGSPKRLPFFCSGCPHNTSTFVPEGSIALGGIGCHGMAMWAKPGTTLLGPQMGGEGAGWAGLHHFTKRPHIFQNMGDGTYYHSGLLALRQAVASKANITFKILYNDAVAMTGGQPVDGPLTPLMVVQQVLAEGVREVALVSEDPSRYNLRALPAGVKLHPRERLDEVQRAMRELPGCTVIVYEQTCAAEKRRRRKRQEMPDPPRRMVINEAVCEGCGDCAVQSGCVSIEPVETTLGRKRRINQSSCNKDYSCAKGFCPSFVTVSGVEMRKRARAEVPQALFDAVPAPVTRAMPGGGLGIMLAGIGGTGVITVSAVLAMAAHLQGLEASVYDMTGMAQKNGAVLSHVRMAPAGTAIPTQTVGVGEAGVLLAFDLIAALADDVYRTLAEGTRVVGNERVQPMASVQFNPDEKVDTTLLARRIAARVGPDHAEWVDATGIALALCGDAIAANFFLVGVALQKGWLPITLEAVTRALELNGVQVAFNLHALRLGRLWANDPQALRRLAQQQGAAPLAVAPMTLDELVADRAQRLTAYQGAAYAQRFRAAVADISRAEAQAAPGSDALAQAAATALYRLMAYKDEYEVARLHADAAFYADIGRQFDGAAQLRFHLAPPLLSRRDPRTGHLVKREFGAWILPLMKGLARLRFLRGTPLDVFGYTAERRMERGLVTDYEALLRTIAAQLAAHNHAHAVALAGAVLAIRGYGHVKEASVPPAKAREQELRAAFESARAAPLKQQDLVAA
ncbi:MAG: indolepyruvate ferredoxin oxidoreductase [Ramlibacter sp.]|nr:indolepyruvate ferredoxin oxidoreductase [Ramlibacter sp.]